MFNSQCTIYEMDIGLEEFLAPSLEMTEFLRLMEFTVNNQVTIRAGGLHVLFHEQGSRFCLCVAHLLYCDAHSCPGGSFDGGRQPDAEPSARSTDAERNFRAGVQGNRGAAYIAASPRQMGATQAEEYERHGIFLESGGHSALQTG